jgi:hypothetical protein
MLEENGVDSKSDDIALYGGRFKVFIHALRSIRDTFTKLERSPTYEEIDGLLKNILPALSTAFNSEVSFLADEKSEIIFSNPQDDQISGKKFPGTDLFKALMNNDTPLLIDKNFEKNPKGIPDELRILQVQSLLIVSLQTPSGQRFIGVANGKNKPDPYVSADKKFLDELIQLLSSGLRLGELAEERRNLLDRYTWAWVRGEWEYLSRASEDYAKTRINTKPLNMNHETSEAMDSQPLEIFDKINTDDLLADYLDAELCCYINMPLSSTKIEKNEKQDTVEIEKDEKQDTLWEKLKHRKGGETKIEKPPLTPKKPWELFKFIRDESDLGHFMIILKDNKRQSSKKFEFSTFKRASLAAARICLCKHYKIDKEITTSEDEKPEGHKIDKKITTPKDEKPEGHKGKNNLTPHQDLLKEVETILKITKPDIESNISSEWYIDWVRTCWLQIYYSSRSGILEPTRKELNKINKIYPHIWKPTVSIIKKYLETTSNNSDLCIDSDWLISWLASNVILSKRLAEYYALCLAPGKNKDTLIVNPIAKMRYMKNLSHHILYVLHCTRHANRKEISGTWDDKKKAEQFKRPPFADIPAEPDSGLSNAQLYIMSEYAYRDIGIHRELRIFERLSRQISYELSLYAISNFYRDHLYHVIDVCLLGELILRSILSKRVLLKKKSELFGGSVNKTFEKLLQNWYVAALCHDLAYVINLSDKFIDLIGEIKGGALNDFSHMLRKGLENGKDEIRKTIKKIVDKKNYVIPAKLANKLVAEALSTDHGVAAWLHLRQWLKEINLSLTSLRPALIAILRHNLSDQDVDIREEPLSFLLLLCDHIQEWGRPRVGPDPFARGIMEILRFSEKSDFDKKIRMSSILVNGLKPAELGAKKAFKQICNNCISKSNCENQCIRIITQIDGKKGITFTLPHIEASAADFEPCISWLMFCRDLQCINKNKNKLPFPISIVLKHAPSRIYSAFGWNPKEMDIFEEFVNSNPSSTYLCQWVEFARLKKEGIEYEEKDGIETFTIRLHKSGQPLERDLSSAHWKDFTRWKWQWLSHKYTTSNLGPWYPDQK